MIRILTYNIHKGFSVANQNFILAAIKQSIQEVHADLVCLQEVVGEHTLHASKINNWPTVSQFEYLAETTWPHFSYGKNAVYTKGHHGNAILSKLPIRHSENEDVSFNRLERRGILHAVIPLPHHPLPAHVFCLHLGLFEKDRHQQLLRLCRRIQNHVEPEAPLLICGDFNDWRQNASHLLSEKLGLQEVFLENQQSHAYTYPSWCPVLALDRIYYRNLKLVSGRVLKGKIWSKLSDHLPLLAEFRT